MIWPDRICIDAFCWNALVFGVDMRAALTGSLTLLVTCLSCLLFDLSSLLKLVCTC